MANTSRPCSAASRAVINEPLRTFASTTRQPSANPLMMRLRRGKFCGRDEVPRANSEMIKPRWAISCAWSCQQVGIALGIEQWRRIGNLQQGLRVMAVRQRQQMVAGLLQPGHGGRYGLLIRTVGNAARHLGVHDCIELLE